MNIEKMAPTIQAIVSVLVIVAFFSTIVSLFWISFRDKDFPPGVKETLLVLVGVLAGSFKDVVGYWLGSSLGSQLKNSLMPKA